MARVDKNSSEQRRFVSSTTDCQFCRLDCWRVIQSKFIICFAVDITNHLRIVLVYNEGLILFLSLILCSSLKKIFVRNSVSRYNQKSTYYIQLRSMFAVPVESHLSLWNVFGIDKDVGNVNFHRFWDLTGIRAIGKSVTKQHFNNCNETLFCSIFKQ